MEDVKSMKNANPAAFMRFSKWLESNLGDLNGVLNHLDPEKDDFNFHTRFHHRRGFVAALDTIAHLFMDPDEAIRTEETEEPQPENAF